MMTIMNTVSVGRSSSSPGCSVRETRVTRILDGDDSGLSRLGAVLQGQGDSRAAGVASRGEEKEKVPPNQLKARASN